MSRTRRLLTIFVALGLTGSGLALSGPAATAAASCNPGNGVAGDLNSDGKADVVVGVPGYDDERGAIDILFSDGERRFVPASQIVATSMPGDRFGASVALGDLDGNGCAELAVGAPGRAGSRGAAYLLRSGTGNEVTLVNIFNGTADHGSFGAQVLLLTPNSATPAPQLVVSAPTADEGSVWEAGQVAVIPLTGSGALAAPRTVITQNSPGVPNTSENGDRFGSALAGQDRTIVIGTPDEAVGSRRQAGMVTLLSATAAAPTSYRGVAVTQNSAGVPGTAETGDGFGSAVAYRDHYVLIGAPNETIGSARWTGHVHILNFDPAKRTFRSLRAVHQDTAGIPSSNETGDAFGSAVALGINTVDQLTAIVGAPGEAVGSVLGAGTVTLFRANRSGGATRLLRQGAGGVGGVVEAADHFGSSVAVLSGDLNDGEAMRDGLVVGVPGEDVGSVPDAGVVVYSRTPSTAHTLVLEDTGSATVPPYAGFGESLGQPAV